MKTINSFVDETTGMTYSVPTDEYGKFIQEVPNAKRQNLYQAGGKTYAITDDQAEAFAKDMPDAVPVRRIRKADGSTYDIPMTEGAMARLNQLYLKDPSFQQDRDEAKAHRDAAIATAQNAPTEGGVTLGDTAEDMWNGVRYMGSRALAPWVGAFATSPMRLAGSALRFFDRTRAAGEAVTDAANLIDQMVAPDAEAERVAANSGLETVGKIESTAQGIGTFAAMNKLLGHVAGNILMSATAGNDAFLNTYEEAKAHDLSDDDARNVASMALLTNSTLTLALGALPVNRILKGLGASEKAIPGALKSTEKLVPDAFDKVEKAMAKLEKRGVNTKTTRGRIDGLMAGIRNKIIVDHAKTAVESGGIMGLNGYLNSLEHMAAQGQEVDFADPEAIKEGLGAFAEGVAVGGAFGLNQAYGTSAKAVRRHVAELRKRGLTDAQVKEALFNERINGAFGIRRSAIEEADREILRIAASTETGREGMYVNNPEGIRRFWEAYQNHDRITPEIANEAGLPLGLEQREYEQMAHDFVEDAQRADAAYQKDRMREKAVADGAEKRAERANAREHQDRRSGLVEAFADGAVKISERNALVDQAAWSRLLNENKGDIFAADIAFRAEMREREYADNVLAEWLYNNFIKRADAERLAQARPEAFRIFCRENHMNPEDPTSAVHFYDRAMENVEILDRETLIPEVVDDVGPVSGTAPKALEDRTLLLLEDRSGFPDMKTWAEENGMSNLSERELQRAYLAAKVGARKKAEPAEPALLEDRRDPAQKALDADRALTPLQRKNRLKDTLANVEEELDLLRRAKQREEAEPDLQREEIERDERERLEAKRRDWMLAHGLDEYPQWLKANGLTHSPFAKSMYDAAIRDMMRSFDRGVEPPDEPLAVAAKAVQQEFDFGEPVKETPKPKAPKAAKPKAAPKTQKETTDEKRTQTVEGNPVPEQAEGPLPRGPRRGEPGAVEGQGVADGGEPAGEGQPLVSESVIAELVKSDPQAREINARYRAARQAGEDGAEHRAAFRRRVEEIRAEVARRRAGKEDFDLDQRMEEMEKSPLAAPSTNRGDFTPEQYAEGKRNPIPRKSVDAFAKSGDIRHLAPYLKRTELGRNMLENYHLQAKDDKPFADRQLANWLAKNGEVMGVGAKAEKAVKAQSVADMGKADINARFAEIIKKISAAKESGDDKALEAAAKAYDDLANDVKKDGRFAIFFQTDGAFPERADVFEKPTEADYKAYLKENGYRPSAKHRRWFEESWRKAHREPVKESSDDVLLANRNYAKEELSRIGEYLGGGDLEAYVPDVDKLTASQARQLGDAFNKARLAADVASDLDGRSIDNPSDRSLARRFKEAEDAAERYANEANELAQYFRDVQDGKIKSETLASKTREKTEAKSEAVGEAEEIDNLADVISSEDVTLKDGTKVKLVTAEGGYFRIQSEDGKKVYDGGTDREKLIRDSGVVTAKEAAYREWLATKKDGGIPNVKADAPADAASARKLLKGRYFQDEAALRREMNRLPPQAEKLRAAYETAIAEAQKRAALKSDADYGDEIRRSRKPEDADADRKTLGAESIDDVLKRRDALLPFYGTENVRAKVDAADRLVRDYLDGYLNAAANSAAFTDDTQAAVNLVKHLADGVKVVYAKDARKDGVYAEYDRAKGVVTVYGDARAADVMHDVGYHVLRRWAEQNAPHDAVAKAVLDNLVAYADAAPEWMKEDVRQAYAEDRLGADALNDEFGARRFQEEQGGRLLAEARNGKGWLKTSLRTAKDALVSTARAMGLDVNSVDFKRAAQMKPSEMLEFLAGEVVKGKRIAMEQKALLKPDAKPAETAADGEPMVDIDGKAYSKKSMMHDLNEGKMMADLVKHKVFTEDQAKQFRKDVEEIVDLVSQRAFLDMNESYGKEGRGKFLPFKPNSDPLYKKSLDFSTLCKKRIMTQMVIDRLQSEIKGDFLTADEQVAVRKMLKDYQAVDEGLQIACHLCYVEAARLKVPAQLDKLFASETSMRDAFVNYLAKKSKTFKAENKRFQENWKKAHGYAKDAVKKDMTSADRTAFSAESKAFRQANYKPTADEEALIAKFIRNGRKPFLTVEGQSKVAQDDPRTYDFFTTYVREATHSKALEPDVPYYYGDAKKLSKKFIELQNRQGTGLRHQSWSDFQITHMLDTITALADLSVRGAKMHEYTKVPESVRIFGKSGIMFNLSLIPEFKDGKWGFSSVEGMDYETAKRLRKEFPQTAGTVAIAANHRHFIDLLNNPYVDYVIPYHSSGMPVDVRKMMGIGEWFDYEDIQHTSVNKQIREPKVKPEKWHVEPTLDEWVVRDPNKSGILQMQESARRYVDLCNARGMRPKFAKVVATQQADGTWKLKPEAKNYWKALVDHKWIDQTTDRLIEQKPVRPEFDMKAVRTAVADEIGAFDQGRVDRAFDHVKGQFKGIGEYIANLKANGEDAKGVQKKVKDKLAQVRKSVPVDKSLTDYGDEYFGVDDDVRSSRKPYDETTEDGRRFNEKYADGRAAGHDQDTPQVVLPKMRGVSRDMEGVESEGEGASPSDANGFERRAGEVDSAKEGVRSSRKSLGVPYQGSKGQIAEELVDRLPEGKRFVDLFSGGGAMTHAAMRSGKYGAYRMNDLDGRGQDLFLGAMDGAYRDYAAARTADDWAAIRDTPEGVLRSRMGNGRQFNADAETTERNIRRVNRVADELGGRRGEIEDSKVDYRKVELKDGDVVYADIPYAGTDTTAYSGAGKFDHAAFNEWAQKQKVPVYVSSYAMPAGWTEIAALDAQGITGNKTERLFVQDKFASPDIRQSKKGVYTGSAADYDKPSLLKVGTGSKSQNYGWGLYGSDVRGVAEGYAKIASGNVVNFTSKLEKDLGLSFSDSSRIAKAFQSSYGRDMEDIVRYIDDHFSKGDSDVVREKWDSISSLARKEIPRSIVYEQTFFVNRPEGDESHLLTWDEPVSKENAKRIKDKIDEDFASFPKKGKYSWLKDRMTYDTIARIAKGEDTTTSSKRLYSELERMMHYDPKSVSEFLVSADIDGIKYSIDNDKSKWNYVSFRDDNINIDHKWVDGEQRFSRRSRNPAPPPAGAFMNDRESAGEKYMKNFADRYRPVKGVVMDTLTNLAGMSKEQARDWAENNAASPYHAKRVQTGRAEADTMRVNALRNDLERTLGEWKRDGLTVDDLGQWMYAMHAKDRNAQKLADHGVTDGAGMSDADAQAILDGYRARGVDGQLERARQALTVRLNRDFGLDYLHDAGLIDENSVNRLKAAYGEDYVPLKDDITDGEGVDYNRNGTVSNPLMRAVGRTTLAENPTAFMILGSLRNIANAHQNRAAETLARFVEAHPEIGQVRLVRPTDNINEDTVVFRRNTTVPVMDHGVQVGTEEVNQRWMVEMYGDRGNRMARAFLDADLHRGPAWLTDTTRWFASFATQLSPTFSVRNFLKDTVEVASDTMGTMGLRDAGRFLGRQFALMPLWNGNFRRVLREFRETGTVTGTTPLARDFREFVESGALIGGGGAREGYGEMTETFRDISRSLNRAGATARDIGRVWEAYKKWVGSINESIETLTRFNNFRNRRAAGESVEQAAMNAREGSTDFGMYGNQRWLNSVFMFSNSILGGTMRGAKTMVFGRYGRRLAAGMVALGVLEELADYALNGDEEEAENAGTGTGKDITEYERENGLNFRYGGKNVHIPMHLGPWSWLKYAGNNAARALVTKKISVEQAVKNVGASAATVASHFSAMGEKGFGEGSPSLANSMTPSVLQPLVQVKLNENYKGDTIYTEHTMQANRDRPDYKYARRNTNPLFVEMSRLINNMPWSGGNDHRKGAFDVPPEALEYLSKQVFKNFGTDVVNTVWEVPSRIYRTATDQGNGMELRTTPFVRDVVKSTPDVANRYYTESRAYNGDLREFKDMPARERAMFARTHYGMNGELKELAKRIDEHAHLERGEKKDGNAWVAVPNMTEKTKDMHKAIKLKLMARFLKLRETRKGR